MYAHTYTHTHMDSTRVTIQFNLVHIQDQNPVIEQKICGLLIYYFPKRSMDLNDSLKFNRQ